MITTNPATLAAVEPKSDRIGDWITTYSGGRYFPLDPRPEEILIEDIAHALSLLCRFNGHIQHFYSVGEHCYHISKAVPFEYALQGLLHDGEEAYTSDIPRPLKHQIELAQFREVGNLNQKVLFKKYGVDYPEYEIVKEMDARIIANESHVLFNTPQKWCLLEPIENIEIQCWSPQIAEKRFLERFHELYEG